MAVSTTETYGCSVSCTGLYADVYFKEDSILGDDFQKELRDILAKGGLGSF